MSKFDRFMKRNKIEKHNELYAATKSIVDENGIPVLWEFKHLTSKTVNSIREDCMKQIPVKGKPGMYMPKLNVSEYTHKLIVASIVTPDLYDAELQDSYGVKTPDDLLYAIMDNPGEYMELVNFVQKLQGLDVTLEEKVEEAKN